MSDAPVRPAAAAPAPPVVDHRLTTAWRFRPDIEGLRAIAILGVILFHAGIAQVAGGFLGVDVFFVLSGFLITGILLEEAHATGTISLAAFWARRARRLLPAATLVSLVTLIFLVRLDSPFAEVRYGGSAMSFATYWSNLLFWRRGSDYFDHSTVSDPFLHTWSLAVEEQYYLLFAPCVFLLALLIRHRSGGGVRRPLLVGSLVVSVASLGAYVLLTATRPLVAFYLLPARAWEFGVGSMLAALAAGGTTTRRGRSSELVALLALAAVVGVWFLPSVPSSLAGLVTTLPVLGTAMLIYLVPRGPTLVGTLLQAAPMRWIGRLSYSWYLWHWPLTIYWDKLLPGNPVPMALGMPLVSLGLAQLTYVTIEHPARTAAWLQPARRGLVAALVLATVTVLTGMAVRGRAGRRLEGPAYAYIREARDTRTKIHLDGCDQWKEASASMERCVYGARSSDSVVVLFGDSHAAQWFPALEPLAIQRGWRLVPLTRPGCPSVSVWVWMSMSSRGPAICDEWRDGAFAEIRALKPFLIVMSNYRWHSLLDPRGGHQLAADRPDLWEGGLRHTLDQLPPGSTIVLLGDNPAPRFDVPRCLIEHLNTEARCSFARDSGSAPGITQVEREVSAGDRRVVYADLVDQLCDGATCPVVRPPLAMYSDTDHLSVGFAAALADPFRRIVDAALAKAGALRSPDRR